MNPLTLVKRTQKITERESELGIREEGSWHAKYKDSAYIFVGGIPFDLTEGDLLAVFAQYGEIVDVNLVRDKGTGKSKGFAFIAYEDQRSTILAVDNLNGAQVLGRTVRVDHVSNYKKKEEEDEETQRQKREARGVCRAFQKGECTRGDGCKFSHDEQRAANTGWGQQDTEPRWGPQDKGPPRWGHDKFDGSKKVDKRSNKITQNHFSEPRAQVVFRSNETGSSYRVKSKEFAGAERYHVENDRRHEKRLREHDEIDPYESRSRENRHNREDKRSKRDDYEEFEQKSRENCDRREDKISSRRSDRREERSKDRISSQRYDFEYKQKSREDRDGREDMKFNSHGRNEVKEVRRYNDDERVYKSREDISRRDK